MSAQITDLLSSAVEVVDLTFTGVGDTPAEVAEALGSSPREALDSRINEALRDNFGEHASASLKVFNGDAQVDLTVTPPESEPESITLGVPSSIREVLSRAQ